jgi:hypothetical protein
VRNYQNLRGVVDERPDFGYTATGVLRSRFTRMLYL